MALDRVRFVADAASMLGAIHPDVPVAVLSDALTDALGNELVGLYAYGSAVSGGFDPGVSDIDLVAVTAHPATALDFEALDHVHREFVRRHAAWENRLEIVYIGSADLRGFRASEADLAVISPGEPFHLSGPVSDWLQNWYLVRETGVTLAGRTAADVVPPISHAEYLGAVASYARWLATQDLDTLSPGSLAYAVLSECRAICTIRTGQPCSKQEGAAWLRAHAPQHTWLLDRALGCRRSGGKIGFHDAPTRSAAARFVRSINERL